MSGQNVDLEEDAASIVYLPMVDTMSIKMPSSTSPLKSVPIGDTGFIHGNYDVNGKLYGIDITDVAGLLAYLSQQPSYMVTIPAKLADDLRGFLV